MSKCESTTVTESICQGKLGRKTFSLPHSKTKHSTKSPLSAVSSLTGDIAGALVDTRRVLKTAGSAVVVVYNAHSYYRWLRFSGETFRQFMHERKLGSAKAVASLQIRRAGDINIAGEAAPFAKFVPSWSIEEICGAFSLAKVYKKNTHIGRFDSLGPWVRRMAAATIGPLAGLDFYAHLVK